MKERRRDKKRGRKKEREKKRREKFEEKRRLEENVTGTKATKYILRFYVRSHGARNETLLFDNHHDTD